MWLGGGRRRGLGSMMPLDFDVFEMDDAPVAFDIGGRFREMPRGRTFGAGGRTWEIINTAMGHNVRLVREVDVLARTSGGFKEGDSYWAEVVGDEVVISALSKRGQARPIGKPVARTKTL